MFIPKQISIPGGAHILEVLVFLVLRAATDESYWLIRQWGSIGTANGQFHLPWSLALDSLNNVYVVDRNNERIQVIHHIGKLYAFCKRLKFSSIQ